MESFRQIKSARIFLFTNFKRQLLNLLSKVQVNTRNKRQFFLIRVQNILGGGIPQLEEIIEAITIKGKDVTDSFARTGLDATRALVEAGDELGTRLDERSASAAGASAAARGS